MSALHRAGSAIEQALEALQHQTRSQLSKPAFAMPSDKNVQAAQSQERRVQQGLADLDQQYLYHAINAAGLLNDDAIMQGNRLPSAPLTHPWRNAWKPHPKPSRHSSNANQPNREEQIWRPLLNDWAADLRRNKEAAEEDWQHMGSEFLASCNVVAITCNEK